MCWHAFTNVHTQASLSSERQEEIRVFDVHVPYHRHQSPQHRNNDHTHTWIVNHEIDTCICSYTNTRSYLHSFRCAYLHVVMCIFIHVCIYISIYIYTYTRTCILDIHSQTHTYVHTCMHACMHTYMHTYTDMCMYAYRCIHTFVHFMCTCACLCHCILLHARSWQRWTGFCHSSSRCIQKRIDTWIPAYVPRWPCVSGKAREGGRHPNPQKHEQRLKRDLRLRGQGAGAVQGAPDPAWTLNLKRPQTSQAPKQARRNPCKPCVVVCLLGGGGVGVGFIQKLTCRKGMNCRA